MAWGRDGAAEEGERAKGGEGTEGSGGEVNIGGAIGEPKGDEVAEWGGIVIWGGEGTGVPTGGEADRLEGCQLRGSRVDCPLQVTEGVGLRATEGAVLWATDEGFWLGEGEEEVEWAVPHRSQCWIIEGVSR